MSGLCKGFTSGSHPHIYQEIAETALNVIIKRKYAQNLLNSPEPVKIVPKYKTACGKAFNAKHGEVVSKRSSSNFRRRPSPLTCST